MALGWEALYQKYGFRVIYFVASKFEVKVDTVFCFGSFFSFFSLQSLNNFNIKIKIKAGFEGLQDLRSWYPSKVN